MIRKIFLTILTMILSINAYANIHIDGKTAGRIIREHIDANYKELATEEYNTQLKATGNYTMSVSGLYKVCAAAGWDISKAEDKYKCNKFVQALVEKSDYKYYEICGKDKGKSGGTEHCIEDVFYSLIGGTQVTKLQADGLCKEYVHVKYNDDIECSTDTRKGTINPLNDYVKCTSKLNPVYYEFKFDDVSESKDVNITASVEKAICEMHGADYVYASSSQTSTFSRNIEYYPPKCKTSDANLCSKINESMKKFGYSTKIQKNECVISDNTILSESQLRTAFGIDNLHFKTGYQLSAYSDMRNQLCEYIKQNANTAITSCECNYNRTQLFKSGTDVDDVLTCYANNQPIDFVFDDLSEHDKKLSQGNMEAFNCSVLGGEYQGKTCFTPDKKLCEQIAAATISECPECKKAYFDEKANACILPNATKANNHQQRVNIGLIIGGAIVGAGVIIYTGGTGFAAVAITLETIGAGMELGSQIHIDGIADEFFMKANNCNDTGCAESILKEYFQYISRMTNDLQSGEKLGIDSKMVTLVEMLPDDSQFLVDIVAGCYEDNGDNFDISKCDDNNWNADQVIRAVGIGLQFTSVFSSVGKWMLGAGRIEKVASKTPRLTEALSRKIPGIKSQIAQKLSRGEKVLRSDGKLAIANVKDPKLWVPGEDVAEYYDVSSLQKQLKDIAAEDAEYIAELEQKLDKMSDKGLDMHTVETIDEIRALTNQRRTLLDNALKSYGLSSDDIYSLGRGELNTLEQSLRSKDAELETLYQEMVQAKRNNNREAFSAPYRKYQDKLKQYSEYATLKTKVDSERHALEEQSRNAIKLIEKENADIVMLDRQIDELEHTYSPEYTAFLNEKEYTRALLNDARKTVGDKQNLVWWDAIPQEIKDTYVRYTDDKMIEILASDPDIVEMVRDWDHVKNNKGVYEQFLEKVNHKLNTMVFPEVEGIQIRAYNDEFTSTLGWHDTFGNVGVNEAGYMGKDVDNTVSVLKHEVLSHHVDQVMPNYGLQGQTMQNFVGEMNKESWFNEIISHGNSDPRVVTAKSPILGTEFSISDASDAAQDALRQNGWDVFSHSDQESYNAYRAEMSERAAWLNTPTSNTKNKMEAKLSK